MAEQEKAVLVIQVKAFLNNKELQHIHDYAKAQMETGVVVLPVYCEPILVPEGIEIRFEDNVKEEKHEQTV